MMFQTFYTPRMVVQRLFLPSLNVTLVTSRRASNDTKWRGADSKYFAAIQKLRLLKGLKLTKEHKKLLQHQLTEWAKKYNARVHDSGAKELNTTHILIEAYNDDESYLKQALNWASEIGAKIKDAVVGTWHSFTSKYTYHDLFDVFKNYFVV